MFVILTVPVHPSDGGHVARDQELQATTVNDLPDWEPPELGLPQASLVAILLVAAIIALCIWISTDFGPKPLPQTIQVTQATLTQLPPPPTPPPPKVVPPPKPIPAVIPKPPPVPSHINVATKPPPPIHHIYKPVPHPVIRQAPPAPAKVQPTPPPAAPAPPTNGVPIYGEQMYTIIQANQNVPPALAQLGVSGTAVIEIEVAPDGRVISASVYKSSGIPLIDQTALQHARSAHLPPFNSEMPNQPHAFLVPIEITPNPND